MSINANFQNNTYALFKKFSNDKKIVVFGSGKTAEKMLEDFSSCVKIAYFVDNNFWKWDTEFCGYSILEPSTLRFENPEKTVVLIATEKMFDVESQLLELGVINYFAYPLFFDRHYRKEHIYTLTIRF